MFAYFIGSIVIICLGIQYIILTRLEKLQTDYNSLPIHDVKDGVWTIWEPWNSCSATCGVGLKSRTRTCSHPAPSMLGKFCNGEAIQYGPCAQNACQDGTWTQWAPWSTCSATCGGGIQSRTRTCSNPTPSPSGQFCDGEPIQYGSCNQNTCPDTDLTSKIESILQSRRHNVAFTAYLSKHATQLSNAQIIPFDKLELNEGKGFNTNTHIFTCPVTGIYIFQTGVLCTHKSPVLTEIVKEGKQLIQAHAEPLANHNQGFNSVITKCEKGENVWVRIDRYGNAVHSERFTTLSGFILWESK